MRVLVACEFSGVVREAFRRRGHDAWSCDLLPAKDGNRNHYQGDVLDLLGDSWDLMIAHPPCTYLTNAGVRHLHENVTSHNGVRAKIYSKERWAEMEKAAAFFNALLAKYPKIPKLVVENPIPHGYARERIGMYSQIIQPWMFGHPETKATCLWVRGLTLLLPTNNVRAEMLLLKPAQRHRVLYTSPGPDRWKKRSRTLQGIADAMAEQWGGSIQEGRQGLP